LTKEDDMAFAEKMQGIINRGVAEAKDLGSKGVLKLEIMQLQARTERLLTRLGSEVYMALVDGNQATVSRDGPSIRDILKEIAGLHAENDLKEKEYHSIGGKKETAVQPAEKR
jgi:hypothetical protein